MELPSHAIRRFSILDSSSEDDDPAHAGVAAAGGDHPGDGLADSNLELSLPDETPPAKKRHTTTTAAAEKSGSELPVAVNAEASSSFSAATETSSSSVSLERILAARPSALGLDLSPQTPLRVAQAQIRDEDKDASPGAAPTSTADVSFNLEDTPQGGGERSKQSMWLEKASTVPSGARKEMASDSKGAPRTTAPPEAKPPPAATTTTGPSRNARSHSLNTKRLSGSQRAKRETTLPSAPDLGAAGNPKQDNNNDALPPSSPTDYCLVPKWRRRQKAQAHPDPGRPSIYDRGMRSLTLTAQRVDEMRQSLLASESKEATFQPKISARARSLRRPGSRHRQEADEEAARLRKRQLILETPCANDPSAVAGAALDGAVKLGDVASSRPLFSPRISERSERIVRQHRSASAGYLPAGERLYRDAQYRDRVLAECTAADHEGYPASLMMGGGSHRAASAQHRRSQREIEEHVASLHRFEAKRLEALHVIRAQEEKAASERPAGSSDALHVDPDQVVERLLGRTQASEREGTTCRKSVLGPDELTFAPKVNPATAEVLAQARVRGLGAWFDYFVSERGGTRASGVDGTEDDDSATATSAAEVPTVSVGELCACAKGPCAEVAWFVASVLEQHHLAQEENAEKAAQHRWPRDAFIGALVQFEAQPHHEPDRGRGVTRAPQIWREKPPGATLPPHGSELTFRPKVNPRSEAIASEQRQSRAGPAHERLFLTAKQRQLADRQRHLEEMQRQLADEAAAQEKRERARARWRASHPATLPSQRGRSGTCRSGRANAAEEVEQCADDDEPRPTTRGCSGPERARTAPGAEMRRGGTRHEWDDRTPPRQHQQTNHPPAVPLLPLARQQQQHEQPHQQQHSLTAGVSEQARPAKNNVLASEKRVDSAPDSNHILKAVQELESLLVESPPSSPLSIDREAFPPSVSPTPARPDGECASKSSTTHTATASSKASAALDRSTSFPPSRSNHNGTHHSAALAGATNASNNDLLLECANCRSAITAPSYSRLTVARENRRRLVELGKELYKKQQQRSQ